MVKPSRRLSLVLLRILPLPVIAGLIAVSLDLHLLLADPRGSEMQGERVVTRAVSLPFPWEANVPGYASRLTAAPGGSWTLDFAVDVDLSRYEPRYGQFEELIVAVTGDWAHDEDGYYRPGAATFALSSNFTTTGIPIERFDGWPGFRLLGLAEGSPFEAVQRFDIDGDLARVHHLEGTLTVDLPVDIPVGHYEPRLYVLVQIDGLPAPVHLGQYAPEVEKFPRHPLPLVQVGQASPPILPWTVLQDVRVAGRNGMLPADHGGRVELIGRAGFSAPLVLPPGRYRVNPGLPSIYPRAAVAPVAGSEENLSRQFDHFLDLTTLRAAARLDGPGGTTDLGNHAFLAENDSGVELDRGGVWLELDTYGAYTLHLTGTVEDVYGRIYKGGGEYPLTIARPLTFSTSCKPGTSFLVGDRYPPKVNVNPPVTAEVQVDVVYYPNSDPARERRWSAAGTCNPFGHFAPTDVAPLMFDEPGEYRSLVQARWRDGRGALWMGVQTSAGVIAPHDASDRSVVLHGTKSFPWAFTDLGGEQGTFADRPNFSHSPLPQQPYAVQDPFAPYLPETTLFMPAVSSVESSVQPRFALATADRDLAARMSQAHARDSVVLLGWMQPPDGDYKYLEDVIELSSDSFAYFPLEGGIRLDHLPIQPIGGEGWHGLGFPQKNRLDAYAVAGIFRPGFPVLTSAFQNTPKGFYWIGNPNEFAHHYNAGQNGDLEGDLYRISAGVAVKDHQTGAHHYDAYASTIAFTSFDDEPSGCSMLPPGERPIYRVGPKSLELMLAADTHDTLEVGETMAFGGVIMPVVPADVTWTVTRPDGEVVELTAQANRLGVVRSPGFPVEQPGLYRTHVSVRHGDLHGSLPGLADDTFWHCAVAPDRPRLLHTELGPVQMVDALSGIRIPLSWPSDLDEVRLHYALIMPGQVLTQGDVAPRSSRWEYAFHPTALAALFPNFDVRDYGTGEWNLAETVVFQFFLEAQRDGVPVHDSLRLFLRRGRLHNPDATASARAHKPVDRGSSAGHPGMMNGP